MIQKQLPEVVYEKISQKFTGKHLCQSLFFNKVAGVTSGRLLLMIASTKMDNKSKTIFHQNSPDKF